MKNPYIAGLAILICIAALGAGVFAVSSYKSMAEEAAKVAPLEKKIEQIQEQQKYVAHEVVVRAEQDSSVRAARQQVSTQLDKVTHEDPVTRDYLSEPLPDGVRNAIRAHATSRSVPSALQD